ncbi:YxeA family protein [Lysinibacillus sp. CNPSo 3705]|uniref:YxeA family protein n=1 Tax=Lysinibacillus sp. CNPSo 3705 TaxID=3028148 RepID=UPI0023648C70|nr:YxeA family protein [Lysinibacillus sp. CNPSo 3705]MDD1505729.1 YxeA family protein [Lysinibacillus sp. CNPSo 3705]
MMKKILSISILTIVLGSILTGCSFANKLVNETYYVKITEPGKEEDGGINYDLKGFNEDGDEMSILFSSNDNKQIPEGTYLEITADKDKDANKHTSGKISLINEYKIIESKDVPKEIKEKLE